MAHASALNKAQTGTGGLIIPGTNPYIAMIDSAFRFAGASEPAFSVLAIAPSAIDLRMVVQQSMFTIHRDASDLAQITFPAPLLLRKFIVSSSAKLHLRRLLGALGITKSTLFPDLAALADDIAGRSPMPPRAT